MKTEHNGYTLDATPHGVDIFEGDVYVLTLTPDDFPSPPRQESDWIAEAKVWADIASALKSTLLTINAIETLDGTLCVVRPELHARNLLYAMRDAISERYDTDAQLSRLDCIFTSCGWDDQGLRGVRDTEDDTEDVFVVEFTNAERTQWEPT